MYYPGSQKKQEKKGKKNNEDILLLNQKQINKLMESNKKPLYKKELTMD